MRAWVFVCLVHCACPVPLHYWHVDGQQTFVEWMVGMRPNSTSSKILLNAKCIPTPHAAPQHSV